MQNQCMSLQQIAAVFSEEACVVSDLRLITVIKSYANRSRVKHLHSDYSVLYHSQRLRFRYTCVGVASLLHAQCSIH